MAQDEGRGNCYHHRKGFKERRGKGRERNMLTKGRQAKNGNDQPSLQRNMWDSQDGKVARKKKGPLSPEEE
jgi:hypothetical protein